MPYRRQSSTSCAVRVAPAWLGSTFPNAAELGLRASFLTPHSPASPAFHTAPYARRVDSSRKSRASYLEAAAAAHEAEVERFAATRVYAAVVASARASGKKSGAMMTVDKAGRPVSVPPVDLTLPAFASKQAVLAHCRMEGFVTYEWHKGHEREEVFVRLIDSYRLRIADDLRFSKLRRGIAAGKDPIADFRAYLARAEQRPGLLPSWWRRAGEGGAGGDAAECVALGETHAWANLRREADKGDILEAFSYASMHHGMLRRLAEVVEDSMFTPGSPPLAKLPDGRVAPGAGMGAAPGHDQLFAQAMSAFRQREV